MSKKYKEQLNKIVMDEEMKKRILNNVLNENSQVKRKKYPLKKIHMRIVAACFLVVICFSAAKNFMEQNGKMPKQIVQNTDNKNKELRIKEQSKNNEENNKRVQEHQNLEQYNSADTSSTKNKVQENNSGNNYLHKDKSLSEKNEGNLRNSESNNKANINTNSSNKIENDKGVTQEQSVPNNNDKNDLEGFPVALGGNPIKEYKTIEEAEKTVGFKINTIKSFPDKFNMGTICVISEKIIQIKYNNGKDTINFRAGKGADDISGDYSKYKFEKSLKLKDEYIKVKGDTEGKVNLALWQRSNVSYSLSTENGIEEEKIYEMVKDSF